MNIISTHEMDAATLVRQMEEQAVENFINAYQRWRSGIRKARFAELPRRQRYRLIARGYVA